MAEYVKVGNFILIHVFKRGISTSEALVSKGGTITDKVMMRLFHFSVESLPSKRDIGFQSFEPTALPTSVIYGL